MADMLSDFDFLDIRNQVINYQMKQVHEFNLMLIGSMGSGKSTLVKSLFNGMIRPDDPSGEAKLNEYTTLLQSNAVKLQVKCIETSNYVQHNIKDYVKYIDKQFNTYFVDQCRHSSWEVKDNRVHACIYMILSNGKLTLSKSDIDCMLALHEKVNLIPVIAKADTFNKEDLAKFKENIKSDLDSNGINFFKFLFDEKEDEERAKAVKTKADKFPFALVAAHAPEPETGEWTRSTICGKININDDRVCDFQAFKKLLLRHCMFNLIVTTHDQHYTKFRTDALARGNDYLYDIGLQMHEVELLDRATKPPSFKQAKDYVLYERSQRIAKVREMRVEELRHKMLMGLKN